MHRGSRHVVIGALVALASVATSCNDEGDDPLPSETATGVETSVVSGSTPTLEPGSVFVTGSSTVEPISVAVSELAGDLTGGELAVSVEGPGTGDGFSKFCAGEADIADASRRIKDEEAATCAAAGIEFVELEVAIDGITVVTSPDNDSVECLDVGALYALVGPESEGFENWTDAQELATEVGSSVTMPDAGLLITGPGPESGTYDTFVEFALADLAEERGLEAMTRVDYTQSPNDNVIVEGVEATETSLGWVGYAFYTAEQERLKPVAIDAGEGCIAPTAETIGDGTYPFSRSLFIYVSTTAAGDNPAIASYVDLYLGAGGLAEVAAAGYVQLPAERQDATAATWAAAKGSL